MPTVPRGLQPFRVLPTATGASREEMCVEFDIPDSREPPEQPDKGWALRPPVTRTTWTPEQKAMLTELYEHIPRLNDAARDARFIAKFCERAGPYASCN